MFPCSSSSPRHAVVTGANKGIGFEICKQLASHGIFVILTARNEKLGTEAVESLKGLGLTDVVFHQLDVTDSASIAKLADFIKTHFGKLDILVNNAGISGIKIDYEALKDLQLPRGQLAGPELARRLTSQNYKEAKECIKVNYYGSKAVTEAVVPLLQHSPSQRIVNVTSIYGQLKYIPNEKIRKELDLVEGLTLERLDELLQQFLSDFKESKLETNGWPDNISAYKMSKVVLNAYTRILAKEFPTFLVNCVHPGMVKTDMNLVNGLLTAEEGARGPVKLALLPDGGPSGLYFDQMEVSSF